jgi:hypothetical protein
MRSAKIHRVSASGTVSVKQVKPRLQCASINRHDFCGTKTLREASREQVENFVAHLTDWAEKDRNALLCQVNSYLGSKEGAA